MKQVILLFCVFLVFVSFTNSKTASRSYLYSSSILIYGNNESNTPVSEIKSKKRAPLLIRLLERKISKIIRIKDEGGSDKKAKASFTLGIISVAAFLVGFFFAPAFLIAIAASIFALVFGTIARKGANNHANKKAKAGIIMGAAVLILSILLLILALLFIAAFFNGISIMSQG
ncbi:MAG: hypothetical protein QM725_08320 [Lacibacter sp.]